MYHTFLIHSSVDGHYGYFHVLAIVNTATMNIGVHVSFRTMFFSNICPGVGLLDHMVPYFNFFRNLHTIFYSSYTILHSHQHKGSNFSISSPILVFCFLVVAILMDVRWYWVYFISLLAICTLPLEKYLFRSFAHFKNQVVFLLSLTFIVVVLWTDC